MNCIEFESTLAAMRLERYRHVRCDAASGGFRPVSGSVADFTVAEREGAFHFFYIERRLTEGTPFYPGNEIYFGHASTRSFREWEVHDPVLLARPGTWEGAHLWAPNVLQTSDGWVMAYTGVNERLSQDIGLADSRDLFAWRRRESNPLRIAARAPWAFWREDGIASCRDPHLLVHDGATWMCYTVNSRDGASCIGLARARGADLADWDDAGPILTGPAEGYEPDLEGRHPQGCLESALLARRSGRWLLVVNAARRGTAVRTWVFVSDRMDRFDFAEAHALWDDAGCVEIVREKGSHALVAGASQGTGRAGPGRATDGIAPGQGTIRLGVVDWAEERPTARTLADESELAAWL